MPPGARPMAAGAIVTAAPVPGSVYLVTGLGYGRYWPGMAPSAARSAIATSARTAAPVPPFGV